MAEDSNSGVCGKEPCRSCSRDLAWPISYHTHAPLGVTLTMCSSADHVQQHSPCAVAYISLGREWLQGCKR